MDALNYFQKAHAKFNQASADDRTFLTFTNNSQRQRPDVPSR